jgi:hypothetical protein
MYFKMKKKDFFTEHAIETTALDTCAPWIHCNILHNLCMRWNSNINRQAMRQNSRLSLHVYAMQSKNMERECIV